MEAFGLSDPLLIGIAIASVQALAFYVPFAAGQFNVSQAGFVSIGAYAVGMATTNDAPAWLGMLAGGAISAIVGFGLAAITSRLSGVYLAIATLAFVEIVEQVIYITPALNGPLGLYGIPLSLDAMESWIIVAGIAFVIHRTMGSRIGYEMRILREDRVAARGIGISEIQVRLFTGVASAVVASIGGGMVALTTSYISPDEFSFGLLIQIMSFAIVGGTDRYWGAILGAAALVLLPEYTRALENYRMILTGVLIIAVVVLAPEGLAGVVLRIANRIRRARRREPQIPVRVPGPAPEVVNLARNEAVCSAAGLCKRFGGVVAVADASIDLKAGVVHGLIGPNGAGKSTLVDLLSGEQAADAGSIAVDGADVTSLAANERARRGIARTFQHSRVTQSMTAHEISYSTCLMARRPNPLAYVLGLPKARAVHRQARQRAREILDEIGLGASAQEQVRDLGWEQQRRLEIARALGLEPRVLLLDEPTAGMHAGSLPAITALVRGLARNGMAVLLIEHNVSFMRSTVDVLYAMESGRMVASGAPELVLQDRTVIDSYLGTRAG